jgi:hypothetical protein
MDPEAGWWSVTTSPESSAEKDYAVIVEVDGTMVVMVTAESPEAAREKVEAMIEDGSALKEAEDLELQRVICTSYVEEA